MVEKEKDLMKIVLTGGGTSGHITPNIALIPELQSKGFEVHYVGTKNGMERKLIAKVGIPYHSINAGKLRRYFDIKNFTDPFRIIHGLLQAIILLLKLKPQVVFSKGGFVTVPVVWAAKLLKIPVVIHESDFTPGLANRLALPFASKVCCAFPETSKHIPENKFVLTGIPIRKEIFEGNPSKGREICSFNEKKPILIIMGGSQGSKAINSAIRDKLQDLLELFQICHLCGKGNLDETLNEVTGYKQIEYANEDLPDLLSMSDIALSRAGATALFEFTALKKPNLLIPLSAKVSRGDQILNAGSFEKRGMSKVLSEEKLTPETLMNNLQELYSNRKIFIEAMEQNESSNSIEKIVDLLLSISRK